MHCLNEDRHVGWINLGSDAVAKIKYVTRMTAEAL
jgi:hypothetical protein